MIKRQDKLLEEVVWGVEVASDPWLSRTVVYTCSFWRRSARFRGDQRSRTLNGALLTLGELLVLLRKLSPLQKVRSQNKCEQRTSNEFCNGSKTGSASRCSRLDLTMSFISFSRGQSEPFTKTPDILEPLGKCS